MKVGVIGAGSWGTALAIIAGRAGHDVRLWSRNSAVVGSINQEHLNPCYLKAARIPDNVRASEVIREVAEAAELLILAAPSHATRELVSQVSTVLRPETIVVSAAKGIEVETGKRISEIVEEVVSETARPRFVCLSGPSFAKEVVENHPTAVVAAGADHEATSVVQSALSVQNFRIYTNDDVVGTELAGSLKNVIAIAAGMVAGMGFGSNSLAALITRGLAEITRLAVNQGARVETMIGLAGVGDLVLTCTGSLSRNRFVGEELGKARPLEEIQAQMSEVAEGVKTTRAAKILADKVGIQMPITNEVHAVLYAKKLVRDAVAELMSRPLQTEKNW
ncbi:MAG TPA: NAD(P)H-dependent glycerol-3-phosphate dehydrogenase [Pyrinomonadaceae bacterium]|nr:NAD(P)H-dependent glycerol-3-phosphate dehydrogenase [Pyrinomonadaceae bacterium]